VEVPLCCFYPLADGAQGPDDHSRVFSTFTSRPASATVEFSIRVKLIFI